MRQTINKGPSRIATTCPYCHQEHAVNYTCNAKHALTVANNALTERPNKEKRTEKAKATHKAYMREYMRAKRKGSHPGGVS